MQRSAILFDLDGTLVDTAADLAWSLNQALTGFGRRQVEVQEVRGMIGGGIANLVALGLQATGGSVVSAELERLTEECKTLYDEHVADRSKPFPGVIESLPDLAAKGWSMGVCTNKPEETSRRLLAALGIGKWLPVIVGGDTLEVRKPDPAMALAVMDRLSTGLANSVLVGDSETDVILARNVGVPVILVDYGYTQEPVETLGGDAVISSFAELPDAFAALP